MLGIQNRWYFLDVSWISEINRKRGFPLLKRDCEWVAIGSPKILRTIHIPSCSVGISHFVCLNPHLVAFYYSNWSIDPSSHQNMCMEPTRNCSSEKNCPFKSPFLQNYPWRTTNIWMSLTENRVLLQYTPENHISKGKNDDWSVDGMGYPTFWQPQFSPPFSIRSWEASSRRFMSDARR